MNNQMVTQIKPWKLWETFIQWHFWLYLAAHSRKMAASKTTAFWL